MSETGDELQPDHHHQRHPPGSGFGSRIMDAMTRELAARGITTLKLFTTEDNLCAVQFFRRHRFRLTHIHPDALDHVRALKPDVPLLADDGQPLRDTWEMERVIV